VYVEEIPSGVRTIVGVATSITAFVGRAVSGPSNQPVLINSFADFDRQFGGMDVNYPLSYAVNDYYQNGGSQAIIVRVTAAAAASAAASVNGLNLIASSPGTWGNNLTAAVDTLNITDKVAANYGLTTADLFNLTITESAGGRTLSQERFLNLTFKADDPTVPASVRAMRVDKVLAQSSQLVRLNTKTVKGITGPDLPTASPVAKPAKATAEGAAAAAPKPAVAAAPTPFAGGTDVAVAATDIIGDPNLKTGVYALETADLFNLLCIPPDTLGGDTDPALVYSPALEYCVSRRAVLIVDPPSAWSANPITAANTAAAGLDALGLFGENTRNAALYFPRLVKADPLSNGQLTTVVPCGTVAGIMARTDVSRGVWKSPAGVDATLNGVSGLDVNLTNAENGTLNPLAINCLRNFPVIGPVVWGARTLRGADQLADDYKYLSVRRLALFLEESLYRGTQWVVFEPNDYPLWSQIRLNVGSFMHNLFVQGAFQGQTPTDAYFVNCDSTTNPQNQIDLGIVNVVVGFAPLKPAEFVVLQIQQIAGNILT
jgi:phage tail sheath protein FI